MTDGIGDNEIAMLSMSLLFAGHETTVRQLGLGALLLLTNRDQWQALQDDPSQVGTAVDEIMRAPGKGGGGIPRYARTDIDIGGVTVRAGELVLLDNGAANHDAAAFPEPDRFDVARPWAASHLTFGHGARYCLGAPLARVELETVFGQLVLRFPTLRLAAPVDALTLRVDTLAGGLVELPVAW